MVRRFGTIAALVVLLVAGLPRGAAAQSTTDIVIEWNQILTTTLAIPGAQPPTIFFPRPYAILHAAIFDAVNSVARTHAPYASFSSHASSSASQEVAAAQAAHDVMVATYPNQASIFDAALAVTAARFAGEAGTQGALAGAEAARAILELRANDGWTRAQPPYILPDLPGYWQPVPPANAPAAFTQYPDVTPFVLSNNRQFLMEAPPALTSERYARDFNEVKTLGAANSTVRTAEQTQQAQRWAGVGYTPGAQVIWYNVLRDLARQQGLSGVETARRFALLAMTMHDALLTSFSGKFLYGLWRPVTAIRNADRDGNDATTADPAFVSLIATPPYPTYPGNMACIGWSSVGVMTRMFGRADLSFTATWNGVNQPNVTRSYTSFNQLADEETQSRIYAGIHFTFDHTASAGVCPLVGQYAADNYLRPR
jgi:hypothetical protein